MSSRGRKSGDPLDRYDTPTSAVRTFLRAWTETTMEIEGLWDAHAVWEPAAGAGNMLAPLRETFPDADVIGTDIEPRCAGVRLRDFLDTWDIRADVIITNPPFRLAEQFVRHALDVVADDGWVVMFLRAGFLESKQRRNFFEEHMPEQVWFLRSRPRFTGPNTDGESTDMALYAWFIWRRSTLTPLFFEGRFV